MLYQNWKSLEIWALQLLQSWSEIEFKDKCDNGERNKRLEIIFNSGFLPSTRQYICQEDEEDW